MDVRKPVKEKPDSVIEFLVARERWRRNLSTYLEGRHAKFDSRPIKA